MADNLTDDQLELLSKALAELRKSLVLSDKTQAALAAAVNKDTDAFEDNTDALVEQESVIKNFGKDMKGFAGDVVDAAEQLRENRENFTSLNPAIRTAGQLFGASGKALGSVAESAGDAVQGLADASKGWKGFATTMVAGGLIKGLGSAFKHGSEAAAGMAVAFGEFATGELQNVVEAYRKVGSAGAIGAGGMSQMYEAAVDLGIGLSGYADVVSRNSKTLAFSAGGTLAGTQALVGMVKSSKQYEDQLLALGFTFSEMRDQSAKFLERNRLIGNISLNDTKRLAEANNAYLLQLDRLARVTGKNRDEIQKQLDQSMKNVRFQATLRMMRKEGLEAEADQALDLANMLANEYGEEYRKGFEDILGGAANTPEAQKLLMAIGGEGKQAILDLRRGGIKDAMVAFRHITSGMRQTFENYGGDEGLGAVGNMGSAINDMILGMMKASTVTPEYLDNMEKSRKEQGDAAKADDEATKRAIEAQKKMQEMSQKLDDIVRKEVLPHAAESVEAFTDVIKDFVDVASDALGKKTPRAGAGAAQDGAFTAEEAEAAKPRLALAAQQRQIAESQSYADWQKSKGALITGKTRMYDKEYGVEAYMKETGIAPVMTVPGGKIPGETTPSTQQILDTIKKRESNGNYTAKNPRSTASGAYQFIDSTWQGLAKKYSIGTEYARAMDAPPDVQDAVAAKYAEELLKKAGGDVSKIPLAWYTGNINGKMSAAGLAANLGQNAEEYQKKWLEEYTKSTGAGEIAGATLSSTTQPQQLKSDRVAELKTQILEDRERMSATLPGGVFTTQNTGGPHAANGGIFSGPKSGYSATLHGTEAVVPLVENNKVPVDMNGMSTAFETQTELLEEQTASLEELLRTLRQGADLSQRILRASQV